MSENAPTKIDGFVTISGGYVRLATKTVWDDGYEYVHYQTESKNGGSKRATVKIAATFRSQS